MLGVSLFRFVWVTILILSIQIWVLSPMLFFGLASAFIYPVVLFFLPMDTRQLPLIWVGFGVGLIVDWAMLTPGLHTAALTLVAFLRYYVLLPMVSKHTNLSLLPSYKSLGKSATLLLAILLLVHHGVIYTLSAGVHFSLANLLSRMVASFAISYTLGLLAISFLSVRFSSRSSSHGQ